MVGNNVWLKNKELSLVSYAKITKPKRKLNNLPPIQIWKFLEDLVCNKFQNKLKVLSRKSSFQESYQTFLKTSIFLTKNSYYTLHNICCNCFFLIIQHKKHDEHAVQDFTSQLILNLNLKPILQAALSLRLPATTPNYQP